MRYYISIIFFTILFSVDNPCDHQIFETALEKGLGNLNETELDLYNLMKEHCAQDENPKQFKFNSNIKFSFSYSLGGLYGLSPFADESWSNMGHYDLIGAEANLTDKLVLTLTYGKSSFKGIDINLVGEPESTESVSDFGIGLYYRLKKINIGAAYIISKYEVELSDPDNDYFYDDGSISVIIISPFIGAEHRFNNSSISLEIRNHFNFNYFDVPVNDFETFDTSQFLLLKFYFN